MSSSRALPLEVRDKRIWGVPVPEIERGTSCGRFNARGYNPATTPCWWRRRPKPSRDPPSALKIAVHETRLRRLGEEIRKTNSRVNALEQIFIPGLHRDVAGLLPSSRNELGRTLSTQTSQEQASRGGRLTKRSPPASC